AATVVSATMQRRSARVMTSTWKSIMRAPSPPHRPRDPDVPGLVVVVVDRVGTVHAEGHGGQGGDVPVAGPGVRPDVVEVVRVQERVFVPQPVVEPGAIRVAVQREAD